MFLTDGWKAYPRALIQVFGRVYRLRRKGKVGRKPKPRLVAPDNLFYAQVVKVRDATGTLVEVTQKVVFGGPRRFFKQLRKGGWAPPFRRRLWKDGMARFGDGSLLCVVAQGVCRGLRCAIKDGPG